VARPRPRRIRPDLERFVERLARRRSRTEALRLRERFRTKRLDFDAVADRLADKRNDGDAADSQLSRLHEHEEIPPPFVVDSDHVADNRPSAARACSRLTERNSPKVSPGFAKILDPGAVLDVPLENRHIQSGFSSSA